jgi:signal transduction histidine kinase
VRKPRGSPLRVPSREYTRHNRDVADAGGRSDQGLFSAVVAVAAGLELHSTLRRIVSAAVDLSNATYGALGVIDDAGNVTEFIHVGMAAEVVDEIGALPEGRGVLGLLVQHPLPMRIDDLTAHPSSAGFPANHPVMRSFLGVPVRVRGRVFGNLYLTEKRDGTRFSAEDERTVTALAAAAAVAIENARLFEHTRLRGEWQQALSVIDGVVFSGGTPEHVLAAAAEQARRISGADAVLVREGDSGVDSGVDRGVDSGVDSGVGDGAYADLLPMSCVRGVNLAVRTPDRNIGTIVLGWSSPGQPMSADELTLAREFAAQAAVTVTLATARLEQERLAVYEDRDRIARDLHDLVIQRLFATGMMLQGVTRLTNVPDPALDRVSRAVDELDETIKEIRQTIFALHEPLEAGSDSVRGMVLTEVAQSAALLGFTPAVRFIGPVDSVVTRLLAENIVAVLRESLTNAAKHAQASRVDVLLETADGILALTVTDDGVGIDNGGRRSGLANILARAQSLGGQCFVERVADTGGTRVHWAIRL